MRDDFFLYWIFCIFLNIISRIKWTAFSETALFEIFKRVFITVPNMTFVIAVSPPNFEIENLEIKKTWKVQMCGASLKFCVFQNMIKYTTFILVWKQNILFKFQFEHTQNYNKQIICKLLLIRQQKYVHQNVNCHKWLWYSGP